MYVDIISPNLIRSGEGFYFKTKFHNVISKKVSLSVLDLSGNRLFFNTFDFEGEKLIEPKIEIPGVYVIKIAIEGVANQSTFKLIVY